MNLSTRTLGWAFTAITLLIGACAPLRKPPPASEVAVPAPAPAPAREPEVAPVDPMADVAGDRPLPEAAGMLERIDCMSGVEDLQARMALEALGGSVSSFAYYSKWKPYTCSMDFERTRADTKWRLMPDGATRVQSPHGMFIIRSRHDAYVFEFRNVQRGKFCGMAGHINGIMTIRRGVSTPDCSVEGILDRN